MELIQGMRNNRELLLLKRYLREREVGILPVSEGISSRAIFLMELYSLSHGMRMADSLIAATVLEYGETLITGNVGHYKPIEDLPVKRFSP